MGTWRSETSQAWVRKPVKPSAICLDFVRGVSSVMASRLIATFHCKFGHKNLKDSKQIYVCFQKLCFQSLKYLATFLRCPGAANVYVH